LGVLTRAVRNISRRKMRALLVIIALGFSMAIMTSIPAGIVASQQAAQRLSENYNSTLSGMVAEINQSMSLIEITNSSGFPYSGSPFGNSFGFMSGNNQNFMDESLMYNISSISGVQAVVPLLEQSEGTYENGSSPFGGAFTRFRVDYTIQGVPLNSSIINNYSILPTNITAGRNLQENDTGVVLLGENNTGYFGVGVGGKAYIEGSYFEVIGVHGASGYMDNTMLYMNISDAQRITGLTGKISTLDVYAESSSEVTSVANQINATLSAIYGAGQLSVSTPATRLARIDQMQNQTITMLNEAEATLSQTQSVAFQEIVLAVGATCLIVLFVMLYTVRERTKEIGTLKAIGFSNWSVMRQFMLEGVLLSLMAGIVGIAIGTVGASTLSGLLLPSLTSLNPFGSRGTFTYRGNFPNGGTNLGIPGLASASVSASASPTPFVMLLVLCASVVLGAVGSLYPAWRASRTKPAESMRYE
jgi:putative ABC transport system permease protein